jgi:ABC-type amino acid transport substrate-binding protein
MAHDMEKETFFPGVARSPGQQRQRNAAAASIVLRIVALLLLLWVQALPATASSVEASQTYHIVGNNAIPPIIHLNDRKAVGLAVDLIDAVAEKANLAIQVDAMAWPDAQAHVLEGKADALLHINASPEREQLYDFSAPLLAAHFHLFRLNTRPTIRNLATLQGSKVGVEAGGFPESFLRQYAQIQRVVIPDWKTGFDLLATGQLDAILVDRWVGEYQLSRHDISGVVVVEPAIVNGSAHIAVRKGNQALLERINFGLQAIDQDGTRQQIEEKWKAKEVVYFTREKLDELTHIVAFGVIVLLLGFSLKVFRDSRAIRQINHQLASENAERKRAEAALQQTLDSLEQRVAERTAELRAASAEMREKEARLRLALEAAFMISFEWDIPNNQVHRDISTNPALAPTSKQAPSTFEAVCDAVHPQDREQFIANVKAALARADGFYRNEYRIQAPDGTTLWMQEHGLVEHDAAGQPIRLIGLSQDITERKQAEAALRKRNAELDIFNQAMVGRELEMIRLKQSINQLSAQLGQAEPYCLDFLDHPDAACANDSTTPEREAKHA